MAGSLESGWQAAGRQAAPRDQEEAATNTRKPVRNLYKETGISGCHATWCMQAAHLVAVVAAGHHHGLELPVLGAGQVGGLEGAEVADIAALTSGSGLANLVHVRLAVGVLNHHDHVRPAVNLIVVGAGHLGAHGGGEEAGVVACNRQRRRLGSARVAGAAQSSHTQSSHLPAASLACMHAACMRGWRTHLMMRQRALTSLHVVEPGDVVLVASGGVLAHQQLASALQVVNVVRVGQVVDIAPAASGGVAGQGQLTVISDACNAQGSAHAMRRNLRRSGLRTAALPLLVGMGPRTDLPLGSGM